MTNLDSDAENCTEKETSERQTAGGTPIHEIGTVASSVTYEDGSVRLEASSGAVEFRFMTPDLARATAESILPDGYAVVEESRR